MESGIGAAYRELNSERLISQEDKEIRYQNTKLKYGVELRLFANEQEILRFYSIRRTRSL